MQVHIKQENQVKASQWEHYAFVVLFILSREKREREPTGKVRHQMRDILMVGDCATTTANFGFNFQQIQPAAAEGAVMQ